MTTLRPTTSIPVPDLPQLQATLTSLQTAAHILAGLTHRNKNQHRGTKWWTPFAMLRRSLHKLIPDLEGAITRAELVPPSASSSKRKKATATAPPVKTAKQPELERVVERAVWLKEVLGGRAYECVQSWLALVCLPFLLTWQIERSRSLPLIGSLPSWACFSSACSRRSKPLSHP